MKNGNINSGGVKSVKRVGPDLTVLDMARYSQTAKNTVDVQKSKIRSIDLTFHAYIHVFT